MINGKCFLRENLSTTKYRDGTDIPEETVDANWALLTSGAYCWWSNDISYKVPFGALYNWYAIDPATNGGKELCMTGWHVATEADLNALTSFLGVSSGDKLKEIGTLHWFAGNNGTNSSGFTALPAGNRDNSGVFSVDIYYEGDYWTSTTSTANNAKYALFYYNSSSIVITAYSKKYGNPVRCAKD